MYLVSKSTKQKALLTAHTVMAHYLKVSALQ